jgi:hypothetical protein
MCSECNLMCKEISVAWMGGWVLVVVVGGVGPWATTEVYDEVCGFKLLFTHNCCVSVAIMLLLLFPLGLYAALLFVLSDALQYP